MMRDDYRYLYVQPTAPPQRATGAYTDPVRSDEERRQRASKLAKQEAALRRAKLAERWIVFTVAGVLAITMLPVVVVIAAIASAVALWRRTVRGIKRFRFRPAPVSAPLPDSLRDHATRAPSSATVEERPCSFAGGANASGREVARAY